MVGRLRATEVAIRLGRDLVSGGNDVVPLATLVWMLSAFPPGDSQAALHLCKQLQKTRPILGWIQPKVLWIPFN